jgi:kynureninase
MTIGTTGQFVNELDAKNGIKNFRKEFLIPSHNGKEAIYFLGNSLGLQPVRTREYIHDVLDEWSQFGVEGFFKGVNPWLGYHDKLQPILSRLVGCLPQELVVMNHLTVNLHLMLVSFYRPQGKRTKILCEAKAFPSDQYVLDSHVRHRGFDPEEVIIEVQPREGEVLIREEDIISIIDQYRDELALVLWGGVNYYTGQVFDMNTIATAAHSAGAKVGFDLAHGVGNIPLSLHEWNVDFACWCNYKYLNSGPGAVAACFVHERYHNDDSLDRMAGWWGNRKDTQFLMQKEFEPELSAAGWQLSTPSPILFASLQASLDIFNEAGVEEIFRHNAKLNEFLWSVLEEVQQQVPVDSLKVLTPSNRRQRGCQVSLAINNGKSVFKELSSSGVFADWREPDVVRIAPVALYNTFAEVWQFGQLLKSAINKHTA